MNDKINFNKNRNKVFVLLGIICLVMVIGVSFALWQLTFTQSGTNVITTGCLQLKFTEDTDAINLTDATPTSDEEGKGFTPFTFTIENVCTTETSYVINLETLSSGDKILRDNYIKANLTDGTNEVFSDKLLDSHENLEKVISEANKAYKLYQGKLGNKEKVSFNLRVWLDENTEAKDEVMEATWQGKITVTATYVPPVNMKNVMVAMSDEIREGDLPQQGYNYNVVYNNGSKYAEFISKVIFENGMNPHTDAVEVIDFSEVQDRSVLGYYVPNGEKDHLDRDYYNLFIQANGKIKINPVASYSGMVQYGNWQVHPWTMEGLENLDTSLVTDMSNMFISTYMENLDLTSFDTSNVVDMNNMFSSEYGNLKSVDLSSFDTSHVTNMSSMFQYCNSVTNLDLSSFDTSNVTDMSSMFYQCYNINTTLTIRNKDVTYDNMFFAAATEEGSQITLNYTADTESVVDAMIASKPESSNVVKGVLVS